MYIINGLDFMINLFSYAICVVDRKVATKHHENRKFYFLVIVYIIKYG
jgi:hypothetical protein